MKRSAARVLNTPAMRASFEKFFPRSEITRNFVIPNGFESVGRCAAAARSRARSDIVHAGEIFTGRSLVPVLRRRRDCARGTRAAHPRDHLRRPAGRRAGRASAPAASSHFVEVRPRIPFGELFAELQRAHLLLAVVSEHMLYSTPYKVYDYMARRPADPRHRAARRGAVRLAGRERRRRVCRSRRRCPHRTGAREDSCTATVAPARARVDRYRWSNLALQYRKVIETVAGARSDPVLDEPSASSAKVIDL